MTDELFQGTYQIHAGGFKVRRRDLEPTLPPELILDGKKKRCRVFFMYGEQAIRLTNGPIAEVYQEAILAVPGVRIKKAPEVGVFNYMPKVFVSRVGPMIINTLFGFPKELARFRRKGNELEISVGIDCRTVITASFEDTNVARKWKWYKELTRPTWHSPTLNIVAGRILEASADIKPGEIVLPSKLQLTFNLSKLDYLPRQITVDPIAKKTLGGFATVQNYNFGLAQKLPFGRMII